MVIIERPFWEKVQNIRQERVMNSDGRVHSNVVLEVASIEAIDVGLMSPAKRTEYRKRIAKRL